MPDVGEGIAEGEIVSWFVNEGDTIEEDAPLLEIQNDKLVQEIPSPVSGTIKKIMVEPGTVAQVGDDLIEIDAPGHEGSAPAAPAQEAAPAAPAAAAAAPAASSNFVFNLPDVGEGIAEGEIVSWFVNEGDKIEEDAPLLEIQNDKLVQEIPSPVTGVISKILVQPGTVSNVGDPLVEIAAEGHVAESAAAPAAATQVPATAATAAPVVSASGRVLAMPSVRQHARDKGIDITQVSGTGRHGHITREDVDAFVSGAQSAPQAATAAPQAAAKPAAKKEAAPQRQAAAVKDSGDVTREKMSPTRRAISKAMVNSKAQAPHVTLFDEVEVSQLVAHRDRFKHIAKDQGIKLTYLAYMAKAVTAVMNKYPILNSSVDETTDEIVYKNYVNLGIAVDTDRGLFVPNIKDANHRSVFEIASEIGRLAEETHSGELAGTDMRDGTVTISNIGSAWGLWFTPIINFPEVAIFGMGRIEDKPVVLEDGTLGVGKVLALSLSFDHRIIDGALAQSAMNDLKRFLKDPELLLMEG